APRALREAAAELVLAQSALDDEDAVAGEQGGVAEVFLGEEGAFQAAAPVLDLDDGLRIAALAHRQHLAGHDHRGSRAPAARFGLRARRPELVEQAQVVADQPLQLFAVGIERMAAEVVAEGVALAVELLLERPLLAARQLRS